VGLAQWLQREQLQFVASRPRSRALFASGERHYLDGALVEGRARLPLQARHHF